MGNFSIIKDGNETFVVLDQAGYDELTKAMREVALPGFYAGTKPEKWAAEELAEMGLVSKSNKGGKIKVRVA